MYTYIHTYTYSYRERERIVDFQWHSPTDVQ